MNKAIPCFSGRTCRDLGLRWQRVAGFFSALSSLVMATGLVGVMEQDVFAQNSNGPKIRVVNCNEPVQSRKRGVAANKLHPEDFRVLSKGISWWYNWGYESKDIPPKGVRMEFLPMVWGDYADTLAGLERYLAAGNRPRQILAINEPNLKGQAFIPPEQAASLFARTNAIAKRYKIPVVGPQMAIGSAPTDSITAFDPIENKETTYTFMVPYLKAFFHFTDRAKVEVPAIGIHPYENIGGLKALTEITYKEFRRPVWVTEFNNSNESWTVEAIRAYLMQAVDFLERTPYVAGYAFFKERAEGHPKISLLDEKPGQLSPLGEVYVAMPVHEPDLYYRVPGRLPAENYVTLEKLEIEPTTDSDGFAQMTTLDADATLTYNLFVQKPGKYKLNFRVTQRNSEKNLREAGTIAVSRKAGAEWASVGSVSVPQQNGWQTVSVVVSLPRGAQTLRLRVSSPGQTLNWLELVPTGTRPGPVR